jgi:hypothetical protein
MKTKKRKSDLAKSSYQPSAQEQTAMRKFFDRKAAETAPRMKVLNEGSIPKILLDHPEETAGHILLMEALGTADQDFLAGVLDQLANAGSRGGQVDEAGLNFMFSIVKGIKPRDQLEAMLAAQMAAVHMATMTFAWQLKNVENMPQQDSAERAFNKLARTFTTQIEALKRYRTGGEQKVTVQHVSVQEGGQAIVGNVTQAPREPPQEKAAASPPALPDARTPPMPIIESKERVRIRRNADQNK